MVDRATRCEELFAVEGYAHVRRTAREGLAEEGAGPALHRWLGVAHAAEDDDEHDIEAERAFEAGLAQWPDDLGLLVSYEELCRRADGWAHPMRVRRGTELRARIAELAPPGSAARERVDAVMGLDGPGYWVDHPVGPEHPRPWERAPLGHDVALALGGGEVEAERPGTPRTCGPPRWPSCWNCSPGRRRPRCACSCATGSSPTGWRSRSLWRRTGSWS
ncbi:hypothetical protein AB0P15_03710 [Streptomyces sp. NPDC087917]|uniref:hypothetical protein n=1 Tax=Streptomyces sp. NPDC087917 TaxID=3155060 RepID=UPI00341B8C6E